MGLFEAWRLIPFFGSGGSLVEGSSISYSLVSLEGKEHWSV